MFEKITPGQEIESTVVAINADTIFIDLNAKSEGVVNIADFLDENGKCTVKEGDKIKVFFVGEINGEMKFAARIKSENADSSMIENAYKSEIPIEGHVEKEIKGGFEVKVGATRAFCPYSQMGGREKEEPSAYIGKVLPFIVTEFKEGGKNILVSNRKVIEAEREQKIVTLSKKISQGAVDVDGFQALLPISEVSFERVNNLADVLSAGQKITAKVINADWKNRKVSISLKALEKNPWDEAAQKYKIGEKFDGKISRIADFGLFVEIGKGIDGLVHVSALNDVDKNTNLKKKFSAGQTMSVVIKEIDAKNKRISLVPATSVEQDNSASKYLNSQDDGETYNPFAALLKK